MLDPALLAVLACPVCKAPVVPDAGHTALRCPACRLIYPVRHQTPVMLLDQARKEED
jgi:uncharacterized protein YbaR (Trm112 family)